jgi:hypothetical protein
LTSADGDVSPLLLDAIRDSGIPCELIGHPLIAMAELVRLESSSPAEDDATERTALVVADRDRLEDLSALFRAVRLRIPQVSIWVVASDDIAIEVQRARFPEPAPSAETPHSRAPATGSTGPRLRIVQETTEVKPPAKRGTSDESVTPEEIEMLLGLSDEQQRDRDGDRR